MAEYTPLAPGCPPGSHASPPSTGREAVNGERIKQMDYPSAPEDVRRAHDEHTRRAGITNMKRTLLRSLPAFQALMTWYDLRDAVLPFLGERPTLLFAHAVSSETDCLICSTYFRRALVQAGHDLDRLELTAEEADLVQFGRSLGRSPFRVPEEEFQPLAARYTQEELVALTAFGALMVATNVVNNALQVPLDGYLEPYRAVGGSHG